jgi:hypothetical protein
MIMIYLLLILFWSFIINYFTFDKYHIVIIHILCILFSFRIFEIKGLVLLFQIRLAIWLLCRNQFFVIYFIFRRTSMSSSKKVYVTLYDSPLLFLTCIHSLRIGIHTYRSFLLAISWFLVFHNVISRLQIFDKLSHLISNQIWNRK